MYLPSKAPSQSTSITKEIKSQRGFRHANYASISRRVRSLEERTYLDKAGVRKTQTGSQATLYQLTLRAHVAIMLNQFKPETFIKEADEDTLTAELVALTQFSEKESSAKKA